ncbi:FlgB family protein [Palleronia sp. KMU-117]|uniref:FlgB family protein n=1 Tax=Palleronia sp. KMU-117 TaxID=3434108 RepID=UPI003D736D5D
MFERLEILRMAGGLAAHSAARQSLVAQNVANADTPGYRARDLESFSEIYSTGSGGSLRRTREGHLDVADRRGPEGREIASGGQSSPNGNSVSLEDEMIRAVEVKRGHDVALAVYRSTLDLLRAPLGRGR